jgi:F-box/WD-40 domain protein MET30
MFSEAIPHSFRGHREWVNSLQIWSPDDCGDPGTSDLALTEPSARPESTLGAADVAPARVKLLFSGSDDGTIRVWDLVARTCVRVLHGHVAQVQSVRIVNVLGDGGLAFPESVISGKPSASTALSPTQGGGQTGYFDGVQSPPAAEGAACDAPGVRGHLGVAGAAGEESGPNDEDDEEQLAPLDFGLAQQPLLISCVLRLGRRTLSSY